MIEFQFSLIIPFFFLLVFGNLFLYKYKNPLHLSEIKNMLKLYFFTGKLQFNGPLTLKLPEDVSFELLVMLKVENKQTKYFVVETETN